ncbi:MAG: PDZ domain-containing protein [Deltaproteobacteria bacterium]|nr:PDZ domain-containing protein [Deltaproteobacteria bacterium]
MRTQSLVAVGPAGLVVPWAVVLLTAPQAVSPNLAAIPAQGVTLGAAVAPVFATAPYFLIVDVNTNAVTAVPNPHANATQPLGLKASYLLLRERAGIVLAAALGPEVRNLLDSKRVRLFQTKSRIAADALQELRTGTATRLGPPLPPPAPGSGDAPVTATAEPARCPGPPVAPASAAPLPAAAVAPVVAAPRLVGAPPAFPTTPVSPGFFSPQPVAAAGPMMPDAALQFGLQITSVTGVGAQVVGVIPASRAQWAGFRPGDIVVRLGQRVIRSAAELRQALLQEPGDQDVPIRVLRNDGAVERLLVWNSGRDRRAVARLAR